MSTRNVRTSIDHLKRTGEISTTVHSGFSVITIVNYDRYQYTETKPRQTKSKTRKPKNSNSKAKEKSTSYQPKEWELEIPRNMWGKFSTEEEWWRYAKGGEDGSAMS